MGALFGELQKNDIEIIYTQNPSQEKNIVFLNSFLTPLPVVRKFWLAGHPVLLRLDGAAYGYGRADESDKRQAAIAAFADYAIYQSRFAKDILKRYGITSIDGEIIFNGVDTEIFTPHGEKSSLIDKSKTSVLFASSAQLHAKGLRHYVYMANQLKNINFYVAAKKGDNLLAESEGGFLPENVLPMGILDHDELSKVLRTVDIFCSPSVNDCAPNIVLQAMASGCPVWHSDSGGIPEETGAAGATISDNPEEDIRYIMKNRDNLAERLRERAVSEFDIKKSAEKYLDIIRKLEEKRLSVGFKRSFFSKVKSCFNFKKVYHPRIKAGYFLGLDKMFPAEYHRIRASAWIRCFQMLDLLKWYGIDVVVDPDKFNKLDVAVIMDRPEEKTLQIARELKKQGVAVIYDMVTDTLDECKTAVKDVNGDDIKRAEQIIRYSDAVTAVSPWLADRAAKLHKRTACISDAVPFDWFADKARNVNNPEELVLGYAGMSMKAQGLVPWWEYAKEKGCRLITITEKPCGFLEDAEFVPWRYKTFTDICQKIDIGLCPREDINTTYNKGHSSFKLDVFLAQGIPVIASPVKSYLRRFNGSDCGFLVNSAGEFAVALDKYLSDSKLYESHSQNALSAAKEYSTHHIVLEWNNFIRGLLVILGRDK